MKKLNIYAIDWNSSEQWILEDRDEFDWVEGMFHQKITNEINLDLDINRLDKFEQLEELSKQDKPYVIFVKMYQLEYITERSILKHFFGYGKNKFIIDDINSGKLFPLATDPSGNVIRKGKDAGFAVLQGSFTYDKIGHESRAKAKENPAIVDTDADFLSDELHQKVIDMKPGDVYPHQLQVIKQAYPTQTYLQVINRARAAKKKANNGEGWDPLPPRGAHGLPLCVRPEIRSLMTHKPSLARTKVCLEEQAKLDKDETSSVTNFSRVNTKKDYVLAMGNPDDINGVRDGHGQVKPAEEMYNTKIEDLPWGEWENIVQRGGEKITYGEFDAQDIQWFEDSGLINPDLPPDEATVNNLIAWKADWQTTNFYAEGQKGKGLPNVGHSWHYEPEARTEKGQQDRLALALAGPFRIDRLVSGVLTA